MFSIETGWPPFPLDVTVIIIKPIFSFPCLSINSFNLSTSKFPLNGWYISFAVLPSSIIKSTGIDPAISAWPLKLSKCIFPKMKFPFFEYNWDIIKSAALPWWVGWTKGNPKISIIEFLRLKKLLLPAYDSSPDITPDHWLLLIAEVPLSVNMSI